MEEFHKLNLWVQSNRDSLMKFGGMWGNLMVDPIIHYQEKNSFPVSNWLNTSDYRIKRET